MATHEHVVTLVISLSSRDTIETLVVGEQKMIILPQAISHDIDTSVLLSDCA